LEAVAISIESSSAQHTGFSTRTTKVNMTRSVVVCFFVVVTTLVPSRLKAQTAAPDARSAVPNLSGVWKPDRRTYTLDPADPLGLKGVNPPMTAWGEAKFKANKPAHGANQTTHPNDPFMRCLPPGVPRIYLEAGYPMQIFHLPDRLIMLFEYDHFWREIFTDGRGHPKDADPTWMGNSIGHYEGDTLIVETTGFNDRSWLDRVGHPHSEELKVTERFRRLDQNKLEDNVTIDDPKTYTKPWGGVKTWTLSPGWELLEDVCLDSGDYQDYQKESGSTPTP
jgi:hypothetical protein